MFGGRVTHPPLSLLNGDPSQKNPAWWCLMNSSSAPLISGPPRWWQWLTVLSLDAPTVALLWQGALAHSVGVLLGPAPIFVLGASVWLSYAADRWIEGWRLAPDRVRTQRHHFYRRWRWPIALFWLAALAADVGVARAGFSRREFEAGLLLLAPVLAYLLSHQLVHRHQPWRLPKEVCVAGLLGGGVALFLVAPPGARAGPLVAPLALFMLLCFANCALISVWEHAVDRSHGQTSFALQFRLGARIGHALPWAIAAVALAFRFAAPEASRPIALCAAASGVLLGAVDRLQPRLGRELARVLADLALMTPAVPLAAWLLR
jgi:hypothetical protein